jgi:hypothetical protein
MLETSLSAPDRAMILTAQFFNLSGIVLNLTIFYDNIAERARAYGIGLRPLLLQHRSWTSSLVAAHTFDAVIADLATAQPGDAYFAHILLPHWPFSFEADCRLKSPSNWLDETAELVPLAERQAAYADQVRCTFGKFQQALDALRASPAGGKSIVVVHGDHGSRIVDVGVRVENSDLFSDEDVIASYSTLFAVRAPELDAGYDRRRIPIHTLLSSFLKSGLTTIEGPMDGDQRHWIVMEDEGWNSVGKRELPESWTGP